MTDHASVQSEHSRRSMAAVREELEVARQEAAQALDCLCAEREGRAQDALQLKDVVPFSKHKEALSAVSEQLAQTLQELQEDRTLRGQAEAKLQTMQDAVPREEHERVKVNRKCTSYHPKHFRNKIFYFCIIVLILFLLFVLI